MPGFAQWLAALRELPQSIAAMRGFPEQLAALRDEQRLIRDGVMAELIVQHQMLDVIRRSHDVIARRALTPPEAEWKGVLAAKDSHPPDGRMVFPHSTLCRQEDLEDPVFLYWMRRLGEAPAYHRKQWEFGFICQALWERGALRPAAKGLGFGVGEESLSALFAAEGCEIVGTDQAADAAAMAGWTATAEHAAGKENLRRSWLCPDAEFDARVSFRTADMNAIPDDLSGFDFCWSACALEHLGSIDQGLDFIENSLNTLKPGGWAVHTTELNLTSDRETVESGMTVFFREGDLERLAARLRAQGHAVAPFDWTRGQKPLDRFIDVPPFAREPHLHLLVDGYEVTSVGMIVQKAA